MQKNLKNQAQWLTRVVFNHNYFYILTAVWNNCQNFSKSFNKVLKKLNPLG